MFFYFIFLLIIILLCGRYSFIEKRSLSCKKKRYNLTIIFIIMISSLRFNVGIDWMQYLSFVYPVYNPVNLERFEILNRIIFFAAGMLRMPIVMFFIYATITYSLVGYTIDKHSSSRFESLVIYISLFYLVSLSILRQATAVAIIFFGYRYIKKKNILKYIMVCLLAFCFHNSAIIGLFIYFIYYMDRRYVLFICFMGYIFFYHILLPILGVISPYYANYFTNDELKNASGNYEKLFYLVLLIYCIVANKKGDRDSSGLLNICTLGVFFPFIMGGHTGGRVASYFLIYYLLLIPKVNKKFSIKYKSLFLVPFYCYFFLYLVVNATSNTSSGYIPFRWFFLESLDP